MRGPDWVAATAFQLVDVHKKPNLVDLSETKLPGEGMLHTV